MNYSAISHTLVGITFCLLLFLVEFSQARPWWNAADYDPSLDPVAWSRSFVQDQVRKTRYNYNVIPDVIRPRSKHRHRQTASQMWYEKPLAPANKYHKRFFRRRPKLASREKYSRWRP
ncbi:hypothetical protein KR059_002770 [Drosophila kikkawai]|nr:hypothetical protein KR059_002770 [Drosophila kikkawai]